MIRHVWSSMIDRCYSELSHKNRPAYKDCYVCDGWFEYDNFKEYMYSLNGKSWQLDKDILIKGNKCYSPATCCLVPCDINSLFVKNNAVRGELPIGVHRKKGRIKKPYVAQITRGRRCKNGKTIRDHLGCFSTVEEAFEAYKIAKENFIKKKANEYKQYLRVDVYETLLEYTVEITD